MLVGYAQLFTDVFRGKPAKSSRVARDAQGVGRARDNSENSEVKEGKLVYAVLHE